MSSCKRNFTEFQFRSKLIDIPSHKASFKRFELKEIRNIVQSAYIELPGECFFKARERMIKFSLAI